MAIDDKEYSGITDLTAKAQLERDYDAMSAAECAWSTGGYLSLNADPMFADFDVVATMLYEWQSFKLPGASYTPDFLCIMQSGTLVYIEVKESKFQGSYRDSRSKLRAAAALNPWFYFVMAVWKKGTRAAPLGSWIIEHIEPDHKGWRSGQYTRAGQKPRKAYHPRLRKSMSRLTKE